MADRRSRGLRWATVALVLTMLVVAIVGSLLTRRASDSEEQRLLRERASEIGLILADSFTNLQTQLATTAAETAINGGTAKAFTTAATRLFPPQPGSSTSLASVTGGSVQILAVVGSPAPMVTQQTSALLRRALTLQPAAVTTAASGVGAGHILGLAYPVGTGNLVLYYEISLNPALAGAAATQGQPFDELDVALYASKTRSTGTLVLSTGATPLRGKIATAATPFGADTWTVDIKATSPLVGKLATKAYLVVLGAGLLIALTLGALVEALARRRDYALTLVDERTGELEAAQEQLLRNERLAAIGELASAVGHELRNPLGVITNAHFLLRSQLEPQASDNVMRHLTTAEREVGAATLIVSDLLDFSRAREPVLGPVDLGELIAEVQEVIPSPTGISVTYDPAPKPPIVLGDRDQLRQVLLNLMTNAYEAMPDGGSVTVSVSEADGKVQVAVTDTGSGMDAATKARAFEPFFTSKARGIGLGLAVTKRIVDGHEGTIDLETAPDAGTTFTVTLRAANREVAE